jgi:hypothetical protein
MKKYCFVLLILGFVACKNSQKSSSKIDFKAMVQQRVTLPNGWSLTPIGKSLALQDLPLNLVVSPSKKYY